MSVLYSIESKVKVSYADTDQMGYVHHNNYVKYYETARWELFDALGVPYREMEQKGFMLPVVRMDVKFIRPAFYDEELTIHTSLVLPGPGKIIFRYKLFNAEAALVNKATVTLAFIDAASRKPCPAPNFFVDALRQLVPASRD